MAAGFIIRAGAALIKRLARKKVLSKAAKKKLQKRARKAEAKAKQPDKKQDRIDGRNARNFGSPRIGRIKQAKQSELNASRNMSTSKKQIAEGKKDPQGSFVSKKKNAEFAEKHGPKGRLKSETKKLEQARKDIKREKAESKKTLENRAKRRRLKKDAKKRRN